MRLSAIRRQGGNTSRTIGKLEQVLTLIRTGSLSKAGGGSAKRAVGTNSEAGTCARSEDKTSREFTRSGGGRLRHIFSRKAGLLTDYEKPNSGEPRRRCTLFVAKVSE